MTTLEDIERLLEDIQADLTALITSARINPNQIQVTNGLSDISPSLGTIGSGQLIGTPATLSASGNWLGVEGVNFTLPTISNLVFTDNSSVAGSISWTAFSLTYQGVTYEVEAGETADKYVYWDKNVSTTVLQTAATAPAQAANSFLIAVNNTGTAIPANFISIIYADFISVTSLSAITASMGALTIDGLLTMSGAGGAITIGTTPPSSATVGTGLWIDRTGVYALTSDVQQTTLTSAGLTAGAGAVSLDVNGMRVTPSTGSAVDPLHGIAWYSGSTQYGVLGIYTSSGAGNIMKLENYYAGGADPAIVIQANDTGGAGTSYIIQIISGPSASISYAAAVHTFTGPANFSTEVTAGTFFTLTSINTTISSDTITATASLMVVDTEGGAATDNLATINGFSLGRLLIIRTANSARDVTVKDATGNLQLSGDCVLGSLNDSLTLYGTAAGWREVSRSING
jgi:hypothetical protein